MLNGVKKLILQYPAVSRFVLAAILIFVTLALTDVVGKQINFIYTGFLLLTIATWILYRTEHKTLKEIGLNLNLINVSFLFFGLLLGIVAFAVSTYSRTVYTGEQWHVNRNIDWLGLVRGLYIILPTVATQQLIFRGYPFMKTVEVSNLFIANIIWGLLFAMYHDIWGNPVMLPFTILSFLISHYVFSASLIKSASLYFPIGIHLGHNWSGQYFNGYNAADKGIFYITNQQNFNSWQAFLIFWLTYNLGFIILGCLLWKWKGTSFSINVTKEKSTTTNIIYKS
jgi:hypothetical protein